jgi:hypothetical protein
MASAARFLSFESTPAPLVNFRHSLEMANEYVNWRVERRPVCPAARRNATSVTLMPPEMHQLRQTGFVNLPLNRNEVSTLDAQRPLAAAFRHFRFWTRSKPYSRRNQTAAFYNLTRSKLEIGDNRLGRVLCPCVSLSLQG